MEDTDYDHSIVDAIACGKVMVIKKRRPPMEFTKLMDEFRESVKRLFIPLQKIYDLMYGKKEMRELWVSWSQFVRNCDTLQDQNKRKNNKKRQQKQKQKNAAVVSKKQTNHDFSYQIVSFSPSSSIAEAMKEENEEEGGGKPPGIRSLLHGFGISIGLKKMAMNHVDSYMFHMMTEREFATVRETTMRIADLLDLYSLEIPEVRTSFNNVLVYCQKDLKTLSMMEYLAGICGNVRLLDYLVIDWAMDFKKLQISSLIPMVEEGLYFLVNNLLSPMFVKQICNCVVFRHEHLRPLSELLSDDLLSKLIVNMNDCIADKMFRHFSKVWKLPRLKYTAVVCKQ